ncbi:MAG TPA: S8 family serine peptidase [Mycobacteriales bacterium]|nr:S8 family serine peptidase [Mycobacteriales bacterium]
MIVRPRALVGAAALVSAAVLSVPAHATTPTASYVVTTAPGSNARALVSALGGKVGFVYSHALNGFSVTLPVPALPALRLLPGVLAVQPDQVLHADTTQTGPPSYGLDRIDQRNLPLNNSYSYTANGAGVTAYVIDTGITYTHTDFGTRAHKGYDAITPGGGAVDCNGHGTHVSGTIGGTRYGVAKAVNLVGVRVLDCNGSGSTSQVVAGIDWVTGNHTTAPAVANMSLGGSSDAAIDTAVKNAIADGITFAVAAGNNGGFLNDFLGSSNACNGSPSRVPAALTVAATDSSDARASYSSIGPCVDLWAPGTNITSDWMGSNTATNTISGTSMATPHVTGVAALFLAGHTTASPATVSSAIVGNATNGVVRSPGSNTVNKLLFEAW